MITRDQLWHRLAYIYFFFLKDKDDRTDLNNLCCFCFSTKFQLVILLYFCFKFMTPSSKICTLISLQRWALWTWSLSDYKQFQVLYWRRPLTPWCARIVGRNSWTPGCWPPTMSMFVMSASKNIFLSLYFFLSFFFAVLFSFILLLFLSILITSISVSHPFFFWHFLSLSFFLSVCLSLSFSLSCRN